LLAAPFGAQRSARRAGGSAKPQFLAFCPSDLPVKISLRQIDSRWIAKCDAWSAAFLLFLARFRDRSALLRY
jgi:hypothetical protein